MQHLDQADATGKLDIGGQLSDTPYHVKAAGEGNGYRVEISVSAPRDWLLQRGFKQEARLHRKDGGTVTLRSQAPLDVGGPISVVLKGEAETIANADALIEEFPELND